MSQRRLVSWGFGLCFLGSGCGAQSTAGERGTSTDELGTPAEGEPAFTREELGGDWQQLANPSLSLDSGVAATPFGWFSLSSRQFGVDGKAPPSSYESYLYRSEDGVNWQLVHLPQAGVSTPGIAGDVMLREVGFADGTLLLAGWSDRGRTLLVSKDGESFERVDLPQQPSRVTFAHEGGRFFLLWALDVIASRDGTHWQALDLGAFIPESIAYGNGVYVIAGGGGVRRSTDGETWQPGAVGCDLPDACLTDPGGVQHVQLGHAHFSRGLFYVDNLSSPDGIDWRVADGLVPTARLGDYDLAQDVDGWLAWQPGVEPFRVNIQSFPLDNRGIPTNPGLLREPVITTSAPPPPQTVAFEGPEGKDCLSSRCFVLDGRLYVRR